MRHIDAADYVLGMLPAEEMEHGRRRELEDPAFAAEVRELRAVTSRLGALGPEEWEPATPPPLRLGEITGDRAPRRAPAARSRRRRPVLTLRPAFAGLAAVLLLALGVSGGLLIAGSDGGSGSTPAPVVSARVALTPLGPARPTAHAVAAVGTEAGGMREVTLDVRNLPPNPKGTFYEVWMAHDARHMISLGTFDVGADGRAHVTLPVPVSPTAYPIMDVSLEPADGVPAHSSVSVLRTRGARLS